MAAMKYANLSLCHCVYMCTGDLFGAIDQLQIRPASGILLGMQCKALAGSGTHRKHQRSGLGFRVRVQQQRQADILSFTVLAIRSTAHCSAEQHSVYAAQDTTAQHSTTEHSTAGLTCASSKIVCAISNSLLCLLHCFDRHPQKFVGTQQLPCKLCWDVTLPHMHTLCTNCQCHIHSVIYDQAHLQPQHTLMYRSLSITCTLCFYCTICLI